jgi:hypothetical protein
MGSLNSWQFKERIGHGAWRIGKKMNARLHVELLKELKGKYSRYALCPLRYAFLS